MEEPFFSMKPRRNGMGKYIMLTLIPSVLVALLIGADAAALVFCFLTPALLLPKAHMIVVFDDAIMEKATFGSKRFIRKVHAQQIHHYRKNTLDEIILEGTDGRMLLRVESHLSDRARFEQWLADHHIEST